MLAERTLRILELPVNLVHGFQKHFHADSLALHVIKRIRENILCVRQLPVLVANVRSGLRA